MSKERVSNSEALWNSCSQVVINGIIVEKEKNGNDDDDHDDDDRDHDDHDRDRMKPQCQERHVVQGEALAPDLPPHCPSGTPDPEASASASASV